MRRRVGTGSVNPPPAAGDGSLPANGGWRGLESFGDVVPQLPADLRRQVVGAAALDVRVPVVGLGDPELFGPEEGLHQEDAANVGVLVGRHLLAAQSGDPVPERLLGRQAVLGAERAPGEAEGERGVVLEEPAADDRVRGRPELEEERLAAAQHAEPAAPRVGLPEVDLVDIRLGGEEVEPVAVGEGDVGVHGRASRPEQGAPPGSVFLVCFGPGTFRASGPTTLRRILFSLILPDPAQCAARAASNGRTPRGIL